MEHGGGNNSTFTTHLVSSSGTDTYSVIAASLGSLKGPKHGGANIKVVQMFEDMKRTVKDWTDEDEVGKYLTALLHKKLLTMPVLSMEWVMQYILFPTQEQSSSAVLWKSFPRKRDMKKNLHSIL